MSQFVIRPVRETDQTRLLELARLAGIGFTSLPADESVLRTKISNAAASFNGTPFRPQEENFLFVVEEVETGALVGTTGIVTHVGLSRPFYSYKLSTIVQASSGLGIYSHQKVLHMVNDFTGASEIGSIFLHPEYRRDGLGRFLSRCRYLMMAEFPDLFAPIVIAEIRGVQDRRGHSPFYDHLARHFFHISFREADYINATQGGQFISDLMPKYPIYVALLPEEARGVIGEPLEASRPAMKLLESEGFRHQGYVDVFDAGPTMQAERKDIRTIRQSVRARVAKLADALPEAPRYMIASTTLPDFRMALSRLEAYEDGSVALEQRTAEALGVKQGDNVRCCVF